MDAKREPLIEFKGISKTFGDRNILNRIDLSVYEGEVTTLIGLSGTGKSVTLKHIIGMLKPDEGQILYRGKPLDQMSKKEWFNQKEIARFTCARGGETQ
jgi:phospholipid/cholesterol/gamma-HCH transport system ATP-binding protein